MRLGGKLRDISLGCFFLFVFSMKSEKLIVSKNKKGKR
ncbi:hypothetical protein BCD_1594 (plasmid) [Borrelia crocidurae DOU]|uniref:Uncharacterized protein n=1 Tax=Borrelia crocidurae DOU TaxID=1293575 RepID=W5SL97_9SPIR|nr:hypothetical protein BCD_1594 [Borrelia crocidurae DOU]